MKFWKGFGGYGYYGGYGHHGYYVPAKEVTRESVEATVKNVLANSKLGEKFVDGLGRPHTPIIVNGVIEGNLFEDVDLNALSVGGYWVGRFGVKAELVKDGRVVGFISVAI